jgi:hypothetical protein
MCSGGHLPKKLSSQQSLKCEPQTRTFPVGDYWLNRTRVGGKSAKERESFWTSSIDLFKLYTEAIWKNTLGKQGSDK